jgi:hypothetical protein
VDKLSQEKRLEDKSFGKMLIRETEIEQKNMNQES